MRDMNETAHGKSHYSQMNGLDILNQRAKESLGQSGLNDRVPMVSDSDEIDSIMSKAINNSIPPIPESKPLEVNKPEVSNNKEEEEDVKQGKGDDNTQSKDIDEETAKQTHLMIVIMWIGLAILVSIIVFLNITGKGLSKLSDKKSSIQTNPAILLPSLSVSQELYQDTIAISKQVSTNNGNVSTEFTGLLSQRNVEVTFPVSLNDFNSIQDGAIVTVYYNELKLSGQLYIYISSYTLGGNS